MNKPGPFCAQCPLKDAKGPVWGSGSPNAQLVIMGMCPGPDEITAGEPFVGKSGQLLNQILRKSNIYRERCYTTNVVKCFVEPGKPMPAGAVKCCAPLIEHELDNLPLHTTILTLGGEAFHAFTRKKLLTQSPLRHGHKKPPDPNAWLRGCVYPVGRSRVIVPAAHPAFIQRQGYKDILFLERDIDRAARFSRGEGVRYEVSYNYNPSSHEIAEYIEHIHRSGEFGVDIETPEKSADEEESTAGNRSEIDLVGISAEVGYCMGVPRDRLPLLKPLFAPRPGKKLRMYDFNHGFDGYHLGTHFDMSGIQAFDVMKVWYLVYSDSRRHDLATALSWWTDMAYHKNLQYTQPEYYNACDTFGALWAGREAEKEMKSFGLLNLFWQSEMPIVQVLSDMEHIGVNCDVKQAQKIELTCYKLLQKYEEYWNKQIPTISWTSPQQLIVMFKRMGLPVRYKIRVGKDKSRKRTECCDEDVLELYRDAYKSQLAGLVLFMRKLKKAADFTHIYSSDGRAHARYMDQRGGRIQAKGPDLQNIPEELEAGGIRVLPRTVIIPDNPKTDVIISADFEAIEFFLYGYACKDEAILRARKEGVYIYGLFYKDIFKKDFFKEGYPPKKWYKRPDIPAWELLVAKSAPLGMLYGRAVPSLRSGLGIPYRDAERIYTEFHKEHPGIRPHHTDLTLTATRTGYLQNYFGRIRRFPNARMMHNEILSFTGQSNAADILRRNALLPLHHGLKDFSARLLLTVHDSVAISCPRDNMVGCAEFVRETLEAPILELNNFWIPCVIKVGTIETSTTGIPNWSDIIPLEDWIAKYGTQRIRAVGTVQTNVGERTV